MKAHLAGTLTVGVFMKVTAKDGDIIRVWNGTRNKIVDGELYYAYPLASSQLQAAAGLKADNMEITAIYSGLFTAATLRAKKWQGARVEYKTLNYKDFTMGYAERRIAFLGKSTIGKRAAKIEINSLSSKLNEPWGWTCTKDCNVDEFGDARCAKSLTGNTVDGYKIRIAAHISASILNRQQFTIAFDADIKPGTPATVTAPDAFYNRGKIKFTSGVNNGLEAQILTNVGNALTLYLPLFYTPSINDVVELTAGCDRKITTCRDKFANAINHRGAPYLPGRSKVLKIPD